MCGIRPAVFLCLLGLLAPDMLVSEASAQWRTDGVEWWFNPGSGRSMPGKCLGNCGVDCSTKFQPPGGCGKSDKGYWTMEMLWGPNFVRSLQPGDGSGEFRAIGQYDEYYGGCFGYDFQRLYDEYEGAARWTYHGIYSNFCSDHDHACRSGGVFNWVHCYPGVLDGIRACKGVHYQTWSMDKYMKGEKNGWDYVEGWRYGPC